MTCDVNCERTFYMLRFVFSNSAKHDRTEKNGTDINSCVLTEINENLILTAKENLRRAEDMTDDISTLVVDTIFSRADVTGSFSSS